MAMREQGSPEWFADRCGKVTASRIADVMAKTKTGYGAARANYMAQLVAERLTQTVAPSFTNDAMRWGTETEPQARAMYEMETGYTVVETGMVPHPTIEGCGASPDGLVGDTGLVEIKCPNTATHIETLRGAPIDRKYMLQMHWQMICTGRDWCDFVSFDPRLPLEMQMHIRRVERDDDLVKEITAEVTQFLTELNEMVADLVARYQHKEAI
jgi:putative phage-type endonuclease